MGVGTVNWDYCTTNPSGTPSRTPGYCSDTHAYIKACGTHLHMAVAMFEQFMAKSTIQAKDEEPAKDMEENRRRLTLSGGKTIRIFKGDNLDLGSSWTIEAIARLNRIHPNAHVNTLLSQSAWSHQKQGWSFGITSAKSAYEPRNFIMHTFAPAHPNTT